MQIIQTKLSFIYYGQKLENVKKVNNFYSILFQDELNI